MVKSVETFWVFFFQKQIFSIFQTLHLIGTWKLLTAPVIRFVFGKNKLYLVGKV